MNFKNTTLKKTKIIATTGPTFEQLDVMREMFKAGVNNIRLNISHGDKAEHLVRIKNAIKLRKELNLPITIILDTKGPEIRVHTIDNKKMEVKQGDTLRIHSHEEILGKNGEFSVTYKDLTKSVKKGSEILVDDGKLSLVVESVDAKKGIVVVRALNTHYVGTKKAVNVPGAELTLPFMAAHDKDFIAWGIKEGINCVAASFVRSAKDVQELRKFLDAHGGKNVSIMSKIEALQAINNLNEIIVASDAIMIARGDLGVEIPAWEVPFYEKLMISKCRAWGKPVVVATQMLDSMTNNPRPTRAEVTDVYYAAISGTDSTMLSGESASGNFPLEAVRTMARINMEAEKNYNYLQSFEEAYSYVPSANAESANKIAQATLMNDIKLIVAFSEHGRSIKVLSRFRTKPPILALIKDEKLVNTFGFYYGIYAQHHANMNDYKSDTKVKALVKAAGISSGKILVANKNDFRIISL